MTERALLRLGWLKSTPTARLVRSDELRRHGEPADPPAATVDRDPPLLDTDSPKRSAGGIFAYLRGPQEPTEILVAAIQDVARDALDDQFAHHMPNRAFAHSSLRPPSRRRAIGVTHRR